MIKPRSLQSLAGSLACQQNWGYDAAELPGNGRLVAGSKAHAGVIACNICSDMPVMSSELNRLTRFNQLADAYGSDLYRYALWICGNDALAKDLVQETYLRAWKALDTLNDQNAAKSWLITILRREFARTFERKVPKFTELEKIDVPEDSELEPADQLEVQLLRRNISKLPPKYREPLLLQVVMGFSCEEIAQQLEISKSAVMTQLFRAREQLIQTMQSDGVSGNVHELF